MRIRGLAVVSLMAASVVIPPRSAAAQAADSKWFLSASLTAGTEKRDFAVPVSSPGMMANSDLDGTAATAGIGVGIRLNPRFDVRFETQWPGEQSGTRVFESTDLYRVIRVEDELTTRMRGGTVLIGVVAATSPKTVFRLLGGIGLVSERRHSVTTFTSRFTPPFDVLPPPAFQFQDSDQTVSDSTRYGTAAALGAELALTVTRRFSVVPLFRMQALSGLWRLDSGVAARFDF